MKTTKYLFRHTLLTVCCLISMGVVNAATPEGLTGHGTKLESRYQARLASLKAELLDALPTLDEKAKADYLAACKVEGGAIAAHKAAEAALSKNLSHVGLLDHRKGWIARATTAVADAKVKLEQAEAMTGDEAAKAKAIAEAKKGLADIQANYDTAASELKKAQAAVDAAKLEEPKLVEALEVAAARLPKAMADTIKTVEALKLQPFLSSWELDAKLAEFVMLSEATPRALALFAQQSPAKEKLIASLLADKDLLVQMVVADGAAGGRYEQAMKIYSEIQKASDKAATGELQRLALAVSLQHAVPLAQRNAVAIKDGPATVDPVNRYLHYEKAYLAGELDAAFKNLEVWDYRRVVDGEEPDAIIAWGRKMLRDYRPDKIYTDDENWRYISIVRSDIPFRGGRYTRRNDRADLQFYQNILANGGTGGRRAFFGRYILRAFGVPAIRNPQDGHASLARWTSKGWMVRFGAPWGHGVGGRDLDFLAESQLRQKRQEFLKVKRAQWIGAVAGERASEGFRSGVTGFWHGVSFYLQHKLIAEHKLQTLHRETANPSILRDAVMEIPEAERRIVTGKDGAVTIPAAACTAPQKSTDKIRFMKSELGGLQLHYNRSGEVEEFQYDVTVAKAGTYALTARVVTPCWNQHLLLTINDAAKPVEFPLPYTTGTWGTTEPLAVDLVKGNNTLSFTGKADDPGVTIREFILTPVE